MIRDRLKQTGVNIWVDVDNMSMLLASLSTAFYSYIYSASDIVRFRSRDSLKQSWQNFSRLLSFGDVDYSRLSGKISSVQYTTV